MKKIIPLLLLLSACATQVSTPPAILFGGEMHNSNASMPASIDASMDVAVSMGMNAVLVPVAWDQTEVAPGAFDFALVDHIISAAEKRNLWIGLLWFGSWKNGESSYPPLWIKADTETYFRALDMDGTPSTAISPFCEAARKTDERAFSALMAHLKKVDKGHRVRAVQLENEVGAFVERDCSAPALAAWETGNWTSRYPGILAPQAFMADAFARYVDAVAAAGKKEYDIPVFANAWLKPVDAPFGVYPNGGPRIAVLDIWKELTPHLDWLSPDIYDPGFAELCAAYTGDQILFIPETQCRAGRLYYALGEAHAKGVFGFGYEEYYDDPYFVQECRVLSELVPMMDESRPMRGFYREPDVDALDGEVSLSFGDYCFDVHYIPGEKNAHGLIIRTGEDEFIVAGVGAWIDFRHGSDYCKLASCEELENGKVYQVINGDETGHHNMLYLRGRLFLNDYESPDGSVVPAPMYRLSHQRRFFESAHKRFKVSGIYRIKLYTYSK